MDSNLKTQPIIAISLSTMIYFFSATIGLILYITAFFLFKYYFNDSTLITHEIFTFILFFSLKQVMELILPDSMITELTLFCAGVICFYLLLAYINRCFTSKKLSENSLNLELYHRHYICLIYILCAFPIIKILNLPDIFILCENIINIILVIFLYRYISYRFQLLLEYLKEKKTTNSNIPDIYLPYMRANYYYTNFSFIYNVFFCGIVLIICKFSLNVLYITFKWSFICHLILLSGKASSFCFIYGCLIFCYSYNKRLFEYGKNELNDEEVNIAKFSVVDVDIQQDDKEDSSMRMKKIKKKEDKDNKDDEKYLKINEEETKEVEKEKENNIKESEEKDSLNN